jgi:hypothetical protein
VTFATEIEIHFSNIVFNSFKQYIDILGVREGEVRSDYRLGVLANEVSRGSSEPVSDGAERPTNILLNDLDRDRAGAFYRIRSSRLVFEPDYLRTSENRNDKSNCTADSHRDSNSHDNRDSNSPHNLDRRYR